MCESNRHSKPKAGSLKLSRLVYLYIVVVVICIVYVYIHLHFDFSLAFTVVDGY